MNSLRLRWQCSLWSLLQAMSFCAVGVVAAQACWLHWGVILIGMTVLSVPVILLAIILHCIRLGIAQLRTAAGKTGDGKQLSP